MSGITHWLIAIAVVVLIGTAATVCFHGIQRRRDETAAGIVALSGVSWRAFIHMVLDAFSQRGYQRVVDSETASGDHEFMLERSGERSLLLCKHGTAFVLGRTAVDELAGDMHLKEVPGGFLLTLGSIDDAARPVAERQRIELLDGRILWPQLREFLPPEQLATIRGHAADRARQRVLLSWLFALLAGIAVFIALPAPAPDTATSTANPPAAVPATATPEPAADTVAAPVGDIAQQRQDIAAAIATLADVDRTLWSSESTLQVFLSTIDGDAFTRICPLMERYPDLVASRIQLTPPEGSAARVRFRQCRMY